MSDNPCPNCGSFRRLKRYNKWHVSEIYCAECGHCLNPDEIRENTRLAEMASKEGKLIEFWSGQYKPSVEMQDKE